ncbi:MAG: MBL fold metallo-hydrolase [Candidatus Taylorbacteria bacterium]|nr:MBL fold metallo-hydrolase [Candidatus Taylorbacteria bacterium]
MENLKKYLHWYILGLLFVITLLIWYAALAEDRVGKLTVAFLNIGQGDAIFIESPTGTQMLIDGGPGPIVLRELGKVMPFYDRTIDALMVSNPDKDHMGGFLDVLDAFKVSSVIEPGTVGASAEYRTLEAKVADEHAKRIIAVRGEKIELGGGVYFEVLFPDRDDISGMTTNEGSIMGRLVYGNTSIMFTGDAPQNIESFLDSLDGKRLRSDVLKVGHHGSRTSTSPEFVGYVSPVYAVISDGKGNSYGHPHQETLDTLNQFGVEVLRTDLQGMVVMESDGETISVKK